VVVEAMAEVATEVVVAIKEVEATKAVEAAIDALPPSVVGSCFFADYV
jgi:hypothetical protein